MKIALATTLPSLIENKRIEEEVKALHHDFQLVNLKEFSFVIHDGQLVVDQLENLKADIVIVRGIFNSIKPISALVDDLRRRGIRVFDNNLTEHKYSINKIADTVKLSLKGIPVPNSAYLRSFDHYTASAAQIGFPVVIKSTRMGKGAGVYKVDSPEELVKFIEKLKKEDKQPGAHMIQEFVPYVYDLRVLIIGSDVYAMRRIPGEGEFRANFSLGGAVELFDLDESTRDLAKKALHAIDMTVGGVDVLITKDEKKYILEVNHTAGMVGMEKATNENIARLFVNHAIKHAF